jgi:hypothetical protein
MYFVTDSVRKLWDTPLYSIKVQLNPVKKSFKGPEDLGLLKWEDLLRGKPIKSNRISGL